MIELFVVIIGTTALSNIGRIVMCEQQQQATEISSLLPTPVTSRKSYYHKNDNGQTKRRRVLLGCAVILALILSIHAVLPSNNIHRRRHEPRDFKAKDQRKSLQQLTDISLLGLSPSGNDATQNKVLQTNHHHSHPTGKLEVIKDKHHSKRNEDKLGVFHCTSQVMIMRHCDKEVKVEIHGKTHTMDSRDKHGDRHCSVKGKERSEFIATLFVDPDDYQELLVEDNGKEKITDGNNIPPVPKIKSTLAKVSNAASKKKPQFPSPSHLYALSSERGPGGKPHKIHDNYREIETITPLSEKFHLDVDDRFDNEGDLASDFFESLSLSVTENVDRLMMGDASEKNGGDDSSHDSGATSNIMESNLCNSGMTVVNWKHSRIPLLARALGCGKDEGCPKKYKGHDFDTVWLLTFQYSLLLDDYGDDFDVDSSLRSLESLSKTGGSIRHQKKRRSHDHGKWKITAELVNEGFEPV